MDHSHKWNFMNFCHCKASQRVHISMLCLCGFPSCWPCAGLHLIIPTQVFHKECCQIHQQTLSVLFPHFSPQPVSPHHYRVLLSCFFGFCITAVKNCKCFDPQCLEKRRKNTPRVSGPNWSLWVFWSVAGMISLLCACSCSALQLHWKCQQRMKHRPWSSRIFKENERVWSRNSTSSHICKRSRQNNSSMGWLTPSEKLPEAACAPQRTLAMTDDLCQHRLMVTAQSSVIIR